MATSRMMVFPMENLMDNAGIRWNAVCGETRTYRVEWGKSRRWDQRLTYHYIILFRFIGTEVRIER